MADRKWRERKQRAAQYRREQMDPKEQAAIYQREQFDQKNHPLAVARHEAGHFVVADELGYAAFASVVPNERNEGRTICYTPRTREGLTDQVAISSAGEIAMMLLRDQSGLIVQSGSDLAQIFTASWMYSMLSRGIEVRTPMETMARVTQVYDSTGFDRRLPRFVNEIAERLMANTQAKVIQILVENCEYVGDVTARLLKDREAANQKMLDTVS